MNPVKLPSGFARFPTNPDRHHRRGRRPVWRDSSCGLDRHGIKRGSNGSRVRLWKIELQKLADELAIPITVCHLPPGTSKWNKIEHRLFSFITGNWRGSLDRRQRPNTCLTWRSCCSSRKSEDISPCHSKALSKSGLLIEPDTSFRDYRARTLVVLANQIWRIRPKSR